ncbi:hypothetical protein EVAR_30542_1 [Eumeta japonica]|uniref:Uncharacterized protein n=1 Tax=Eumeta variegata TaxID=151549 RepID=A0A4C1VRN7_EUMVA|nr:hypothetical protein EVAR_30542_1 [Eumeta japonica]
MLRASTKSPAGIPAEILPHYRENWKKIHGKPPEDKNRSRDLRAIRGVTTDYDNQAVSDEGTCAMHAIL